MSALTEKYEAVIEAAKKLEISNLKVQEQNGVLYVSGDTVSSQIKDEVWDALGQVDPTFTASDINLDIKVSGLTTGLALLVNTDSGNLNIRKTPSTEGEVVGKAAHKTYVRLIEQTDNEWWKINTADGIEGYAFSRYLKV